MIKNQCLRIFIYNFLFQFSLFVQCLILKGLFFRFQKKVFKKKIQKETQKKKDYVMFQLHTILHKNAYLQYFNGGEGVYLFFHF